MATAITLSQLSQVQALADLGQTAQAWQLLASFGDKYASAAYDAIANPTSFYGVATRQHWNNTGADFSQFNTVGLQHLQQYVDMIGRQK